MFLLDWIQTVKGTRRSWLALLISLDVVVIALATLVTYYARFEGSIPAEYGRWMLPMIAVSCVVFIALFYMFGLYRLVLRYVGIDTLLRTVAAIFLGSGLLLAADLILAQFNSGLNVVPLGVIFIQAVLVLITVAGIRVTVRAVQHLRSSGSHDGESLLIIGAGSAGSLLLRELQTRPALNVDVVGFLDDDRSMRGKMIAGVPILGSVSELEEIVEARNIKQLFVALPTADPEYTRAILNRAASLGLLTRIMPKLVVERGSVSLSDMRKVDVNDLLGRELTPIDVKEVTATLVGKTVAVTGAAGSIGSELCRQILPMGPAKLLLLEIDESRLYELWLELESLAPGISEMHILDIRDSAKVHRIFEQYRPEVVLHAAAYKHVPLMELEPAEAVRTNVVGTATLYDAAGRAGAERFVLISTDKAVDPANVMGKTKQIGERLMLRAARDFTAMNCTAVRFGNVLGSRGSVVPIFEEKLLRGEPLTVTDPEVTRYFMAIPEAARLVLQAQAIGNSGDIFVLKMGEPVKIVDLAHKMIALSGIPTSIVFTGLRPGEKLHEVLINVDEELEETDRSNIMRVSHLGLEPLSDDEFYSLTEKIVEGPMTVEDVMED